jgi:lysophospholipase L1-like esterase
VRLISLAFVLASAPPLAVISVGAPPHVDAPAVRIDRPIDTCAALKVDVPSVETIGGDAPLVPIEDPSRALEPFYRRFARLLRGKGTLRMAYYSDSQGLKDFLPGTLRRRLQSAHGDAGHGFVAMARPWGWYKPMDVEHSVAEHWLTFNATTKKEPDDLRYGHGYFFTESPFPGAKVWVKTTAAGIGSRADHFEVFYVKGPRYGRFDIEVDGKKAAEGDARAEKWGAGFAEVDVEDGPHTFAVKSRGFLRVLGGVVERKQPGVVIDGMAVGGANCEALLYSTDAALYGETLRRRKYDVVIVHIGSNLFYPSFVGPCFKKYIARHRELAPDVPLLVMTPVDYLGWIEPRPRSTEWMLGTVAALRQVAAETKVPLYDFHRAMGGDGSMYRFMQRHMNLPGDWVHLGESGMAYMADRVLWALYDGLDRFMKEAPRAGCE